MKAMILSSGRGERLRRRRHAPSASGLPHQRHHHLVAQSSPR